MSRSYELDRIKSDEQAAFQRKQSAWAMYNEAKNRASTLHDLMQQAWELRCEAREELNQEYEKMQAASEHYREVWDEYGCIRDYNNSRIETLRQEADYEHREMQRCFGEANREYEYGNRSMAPTLSQEGHEHKERRNELNSEISELCRKIIEAKENAKIQAPKTDNSGFNSAKAIFERAKAVHEKNQADFKQAKAERDRLKAEFDAAQAEHKRLKEEFKNKLEEVKAQNQCERDNVLDKAGVNWTDRRNAKIVKKTDGTTQVYSGGLGKGDGFGHGHVALDNLGRKTYDRKAFGEHGKQNYLDEVTRWDGPHHGVIFGKNRDYEVTFSQGMGKKSGQTIIADGYLRDDEFHPRKNHNHYGPDVKYSNGIDCIEDKGGDRGKYTGPGH